MNQKIFGIGLSKTATTSLCSAMTILGYKSKHYLTNPDKDISEHEFLNDMPVQTRYQEYDKKYPGSKFILTVRDKESWLKSCSKHFRKHVEQNSALYKYRIEQMGVAGYDENIFSKKYDDHIKSVKEYFQNRENDLLIIDICGGDGWVKLCSFLGKKIPELPFPKKNKSGIKISDTPLWAPEAIDHISEFIKKTPRAKVLEFGSGGSTVWLSQYDAIITSVENDQEWFNEVQSAIIKNNNIRLILRDRPYFNIVDEFEDGYFDLVIVDGRDRNDCVKAVLKKIKNGGLLALDDAQRTKYRPSRNFLEVFSCVRYYSPDRYTQIWSIRNNNLNYKNLAAENPFILYKK